MKDEKKEVEKLHNKCEELNKVLLEHCPGVCFTPFGISPDAMTYYLGGWAFSMSGMKEIKVSNLDDITLDEYKSSIDEAVNMSNLIAAKTFVDADLSDYNLLTKYYKDGVFNIGSSYHKCNYTLIHKNIVEILPNYNQYSCDMDIKVVLSNGHTRYPKKGDFIEWAERIWSKEEVLALDTFGEEETPQLTIRDVLDHPKENRMYVDNLHGEGCTGYYGRSLKMLKSLVNRGIIDQDTCSFKVRGMTDKKTILISEGNDWKFLICELPFDREFKYKRNGSDNVEVASTWDAMLDIIDNDWR